MYHTQLPLWLFVLFLLVALLIRFWALRLAKSHPRIHAFVHSHWPRTLVILTLSVLAVLLNFKHLTLTIIFWLILFNVILDGLLFWLDTPAHPKD